MTPDQSLGLGSVFSSLDEQQAIKDVQQVMTHGYIHGHVHQHEDHMHIHGHIHNHDHQADRAREADTPPLETHGCVELNKDCDDIFCSELDDCYFGDCENPKVCDTVNCLSKDCVNTRCTNYQAHQDSDTSSVCEDELCSDKISEIECCEDPDCLKDTDAICDDPKCLESHDVLGHENNLCDTQLQRMAIFRSLLENVQRSVELLRKSKEDDGHQPTKKRRIALPNSDDIQIHFPHRCHLVREFEDDRRARPTISPESSPATLCKDCPVDRSIPPKTSHNTHQSCFHARVPSLKHEYPPPGLSATAEPNDFDFFLQFNNFNLLFEEDQGKLESHSHYNSSSIPPPSPNAPSSYSCKWENCCKKVDDSTLLDHLIADHVNEEYSLDNRENLQHQAFQCEWYNCGFTNENYESFVSHLSTHKGLNEESCASTRSETVTSAPRGSPLLTPNSIVSSLGSPKTFVKKEEQSPSNGVSITQMEIKPKKSLCCQPVDPLYTCNWQIGTDINNEPIVCGKVHASDGDLQAHLQLDHIGLGKPQYECCWVGCERNGGKPFMQRQKLYRHIHIHTNYKPCKCEICGASFAVAATLKQHMRIHSGEKPFTCKHCDKKFTTSSALAIHTRVHSGEKPLKCHFPGCGKSFSESSNLAKHKRVHQKRFACEDCGMVFDQKKLYTKHRREHQQKNTNKIQLSR